MIRDYTPIKIKDCTCQACRQPAQGLIFTYYHDHCPMDYYPYCDNCGSNCLGEYNHGYDNRPDPLYIHLSIDQLEVNYNKYTLIDTVHEILELLPAYNDFDGPYWVLNELIFG